MISDFRESPPPVLAALKDAPALTFLSLDLGYNHLVDRGAQALAELKHALLLATLVLNLKGNRIGTTGDSSAQALASYIFVLDPASRFVLFSVTYQHSGVRSTWL